MMKSASALLLIWLLILHASAWSVLGATVELATKKSPAKAPQGQTKPTLVDINSADAKSLEALPGIGPALANRIIEGRPYKDLADLERVKGLGKAKVAALAESVTFGSSASARVRPPNSALSSSPTNRPVHKAKAPAAAGKAAKLAPGQKININKATPEDLDLLPGIGPAKAQAVISYRSQNGPFKTIEEIQKVKGIKGGTFSQIRELIKVAD